MSDWQIGLAAVDWTPPPGLPLMGNFRDDYAARGVHDPLYARCLWLANGSDEPAAILVLDICMVRRRNVAFIREQVTAQTGLPGDRLLVAATHTHSGPAAVSLGDRGAPTATDAQIEAFLSKAATAVAAARDAAGPASLAFGRTLEERVSFNRRLKCRDGKTHMNWEGLDPAEVIEAWGPKDPELRTLVVNRDGKRSGCLVNFALHPAVLAGDNWLYSADYPGYLAEALQRLEGDGFAPMFANAPCGNVNHIDYSDPIQGRGYQMTQRIGYMLAVAAEEAMAGAVPLGAGKLAVSREFVSLPRQQVSPEQLAWAEQVIADDAANPAAGQVDGLPDIFYARVYKMLHRVQDEDDQAEVMTMRLGDVAIVGFPGEIFCEFGMQIREQSPAKHTIVIELANDSIGYLPTRASFDQGGYEPSKGSTNYQPGAADLLAASAKRQLDALFA